MTNLIVMIYCTILGMTLENNYIWKLCAVYTQSLFPVL